MYNTCYIEGMDANPFLGAGRGGKTLNEYQMTLDQRVYAQCPKAVLAAVAVSALTRGGSDLEDATPRLVLEWWALFDNGIVPQRPPFPRPAEPQQEAD